jgi:hypothetical protein
VTLREYQSIGKNEKIMTPNGRNRIDPSFDGGELIFTYCEEAITAESALPCPLIPTDRERTAPDRGTPL